MTAATPAALEWETHRAGRRGPRTAVAYYGGQECVRFTAGPLLRLRIAVWTALLDRRIRATRSS